MKNEIHQTAYDLCTGADRKTKIEASAVNCCDMVPAQVLENLRWSMPRMFAKINRLLNNIEDLFPVGNATPRSLGLWFEQLEVAVKTTLSRNEVQASSPSRTRVPPCKNSFDSRERILSQLLDVIKKDHAACNQKRLDR